MSDSLAIFNSLLADGALDATRQVGHDPLDVFVDIDAELHRFQNFRRPILLAGLALAFPVAHEPALARVADPEFAVVAGFGIADLPLLNMIIDNLC